MTERRRKTIEWLNKWLVGAIKLYGEHSEQAIICREWIAELSKEDNT